MMEQSRITYLFDRHIAGKLTEAEQVEFAAYVLDPAFEAGLSDLEKNYWERLSNTEDPLPDKAVSSLQAILAPKTVSIYRKLSVWVAAAALLILMAAGIIRYLMPEKKQQAAPQQIADIRDVAPPSVNRARITLANGQTVYLDSTTNGLLADQGNIQLIKLDNGKISYRSLDQKKQSHAALNTLTNPRGSRVINMALEDGSHVWLNAGSSVTYPVPFSGKERLVSITGEAYFEVSSRADQPFIVQKGDTKVQVLGTSFNVNAYDDEADLRVTLLQGAVQVQHQQRKLRIAPAQQAVVSASGELSLNKKVAIEEVMAWKNGQFLFEGTNIHTVMKQLERWYDVEIVYQTGLPELHLRGEIPRDVEASKVLKMLESTGAVRFRINAGKIIVVNP